MRLMLRLAADQAGYLQVPAIRGRPLPKRASLDVSTKNGCVALVSLAGCKGKNANPPRRGNAPDLWERRRLLRCAVPCCAVPFSGAWGGDVVDGSFGRSLALYCLAFASTRLRCDVLFRAAHTCCRISPPGAREGRRGARLQPEDGRSAWWRTGRSIMRRR